MTFFIYLYDIIETSIATIDYVGRRLEPDLQDPPMGGIPDPLRWDDSPPFWPHFFAITLLINMLESMGDLQDPKKRRYVNVPYFWPDFGCIFPEI